MSAVYFGDKLKYFFNNECSLHSTIKTKKYMSSIVFIASQ